MNDNPHDAGPDTQTDRVILDYLEQILHDPAAEAAAIATEKKPVSDNRVVPDNITSFDNIAAFDVSRSRKADPPPSRVKIESRQAVTLPFRATEKNRVLVSPALLSPSSPVPVAEVPAVPVVEAPAVEVTTPELPVAEVTVSGIAVSEKAVAEIAAPEIHAPETPVTEIAPLAEPVTEIVSPAALLPDRITEPATPAVTRFAEETQTVAAESLLPAVSEWHDNGRPAWAQERFECLIFNVAGLKLAVPLITLGAIHRIDRKFNALPHQCSWFLGILQTQSAGNIKVLDTALCVMPERYDPASSESLGYVITIHGYNWGLACHQVERSITLEPHQVKWRTQRGKRPWLAGTVIDHMCALIDTDGFRDVILKAERGA